MKSGRVKLNCIKCGKEFSTHSSNRKLCHTCLPKCRERHYFYDLLRNRKETAKQLAKDKV